MTSCVVAQASAVQNSMEVSLALRMFPVPAVFAPRGAVCACQACVTSVPGEAEEAESACAGSQTMPTECYAWRGDVLQLLCGNGVTVELPAMPGLAK